MKKTLLLFFWLCPVLLQAQAYLQEALDEARELQRKFQAAQARQVLTAIQQRCRAEDNDFCAAMATLRLTYYAVKNGEYSRSDPPWTELETLRGNDERQNNLLRLNLLKVKGELFRTRGENYAEAFRVVDSGIKLASSSPEYSTYLAEFFQLMGQLKVKNSEYIAANSFFLQAMRIYDLNEDRNAAEFMYGELAHASFLMGETERAITYAKRGIEALREAGEMDELPVQLSNLARMYQTIGNSEQALRYFRESADYAAKSQRMEVRFVSLVDLALIYHAQKDRKNALSTMEAALEVGKSIQQPRLHRYIRMAAMFAGYTGDEERMEKYYAESYALALKENDRDALRDWHGSQNFYYAQVKNDKARAYPYLEKFHAYKDSLSNEKARKDFNELEVQYQTERKEAEIARLSTEQRIQNLEMARKNALIRGNLLEAKERQSEIALLKKEQEVNDLHLARQKEALNFQHIQIKFLEQKKRLAEQSAALQKKNSQNERLARNLVLVVAILGALVVAFLVNRMLLKKKLEQKRMLLKERDRIALELHDEVGSTLTAINLLSHAAIRNLGEAPAKAQVERIRDNTREVMENISDIVWSMNPENRGFAAVRSRMQEYLENVLDAKGLVYRFSMDEELNSAVMSSEHRRDFYLVFKEAINNLVKYSEADAAEVKISAEEGEILLLVLDNGRGFDPQKVKKGNGLNNMLKRVQRCGGKLEIDSSSEGTRVLARFPYAS